LQLIHHEPDTCSRRASFASSIEQKCDRGADDSSDHDPD
jgi:hypothetical protein